MSGAFPAVNAWFVFFSARHTAAEAAARAVDYVHARGIQAKSPQCCTAGRTRRPFRPQIAQSAHRRALSAFHPRGRAPCLRTFAHMPLLYGQHAVYVLVYAAFQVKFSSRRITSYTSPCPRCKSRPPRALYPPRRPACRSACPRRSDRRLSCPVRATPPTGRALLSRRRLLPAK